MGNNISKSLTEYLKNESELVRIEACTEVDKIVGTDIPELKRPWFSENYNDVVVPLFLLVSKFGVVFHTELLVPRTEDHLSSFNVVSEHFFTLKLAA